MSGSLGIVVPVYDPDVARLASYVEALQSLDPETIRIEVDDPTPAVRETLESLPAEISTAPRRRGKGAAVTAGFEALSTDVYAFADADGSTPVEELSVVVERVRDGSVDVSVGSRRHPDASVAQSQSQTREHLGDAYAWLARQVLPVSLYDYQCGAKAVDAAAWDAIRGDLYEPGFGWDVEFVSVAAMTGLRIAEVPIEWADAPDSTVDPLAAAPSLFGALFRVKRLQRVGEVPQRPLVERFSESESVRDALRPTHDDTPRPE